MDADDVARFWSKVQRTDGCWLWTAGLHPSGYGAFWLDGSNRLAHRVSLTIAGRPTPTGMVTDHLCRVRRCVRPDHLEAVPQRTNVERGAWNRDRIPRCPAGHEYTAANTYVRGNGTHKCRACHRERERQRRRRAT